jgi:hypothetical protein
MSTPEDTSRVRDAVEPVAEEAIPDLEVTDEDVTEQVEGGVAAAAAFRAIRNTTRGFPS